MRFMSRMMVWLIIVLLLLGGCSKNEGAISLSAEFLQESIYYAQEERMMRGIDEKYPFTFFDHITSQESLDRNVAAETLVFQEAFDFESSCIFIAYGRKIAELECELDEYYGENWFRFIVTFEEEYFDDKVFFYRIDKRNYVPSDLSMECYAVDGEEKVYLGENVFQINNIEQLGPS